MSTYKFNLPNGARMEIYTGEYSRILQEAGAAPLTRMARAGAAAARSVVRPSNKGLIGYKPAKVFKLKSQDIGRPRSGLASQLEVPVALIFNNSRYAHANEVGTVKKRPERPMRTAFNAVRDLPGTRGIWRDALSGKAPKR